jgi:hypothetical protein
MTDIQTRIENAKKVITGNESLLDMLDADGAASLLKWGMDLAGQIAQNTGGMDDASAESNMEPRLKALRQFMRGVGNWAAGQFSDDGSRAQLKDRLLEQWKALHGADTAVSAAALDGVLDLAGGDSTPHELIQKIRNSLERSGRIQS